MATHPGEGTARPQDSAPRQEARPVVSQPDTAQPTPEVASQSGYEQQPMPDRQVDTGNEGRLDALRRRVARKKQDDDDDDQRQAQQAAPQARPKTEARTKLEGIMTTGLADMYRTMTPQEQAAFRKRSMETATALEEMMTNFKATARKVAKLIHGWLSSIPRVNRFFLEQETKLKTDEIMALQRDLKKKSKIKKGLF